MKDRLPWFPCEQSKLLDALASMKPHVGYTYWVVCLRVYDVGGPIPDSLDALARRTGYNKRVVSDALDVLFRSGKLVRDGDRIMNPYSASVLDGMKARRGRLSQSGREGADRRWRKNKVNQRNNHGHPITSPMAFDAQLDLDSDNKERKIEKVPAKRRAPRAVVRSDWTPDHRGLGYAAKLGFEGAKVLEMAAAFVRYHRSRGTLIADLYATWQTWCENEIKFAAERSARNVGQNGSGPTMLEIAQGDHRGGDR